MSRPQAVPPPAPIRTMADLFAVAHAMEADAVAYYERVAADLREQGDDALAGLFARLARIEGGHVDQIESWSADQGGALPASTPLPWPVPAMFDEPAEELGQSRLVTPYRALAAAVRQEERSFAFWTYVAATAPADDIRAAAERMAHEELEHVALLRRERRTAFHQARETRTSPLPTLGLRDLAARERTLADRLDAAFRDDAMLGPLPAEARANAERLDQADEIELQLTLGPETGTPDLVHAAEVLVEAYLAVADVAQDAALVATAQGLAATAISRLAALRMWSARHGVRPVDDA
ncbi:ferritin-like domain-containing protein [Rhodoplanes roseus]|nr:ferritin family protein [Rhodoplanes roseus]